MGDGIRYVLVPDDILSLSMPCRKASSSALPMNEMFCGSMSSGVDLGATGVCGV